MGQEARRLNIAIWQNIIYKEVLPIIIGKDAMKFYDVEPLESGFYKHYDENVDARTSHAFTIATRFGHSMSKRLLTLTSEYGEDEYFLLTDLFGNCTFIENPNVFEDLYRGMLTYGPPSDNCVTETLKHTPELIEKGVKLRFNDLIAVDIQRSREIGLAGYNRFRQFCRSAHLSAVEQMDDLQNDISQEDIRLLKSLYGSVDDIDYYIGGMLERPVEGGLVGPTFACIIGEQFERLKKGDRFYYENESEFVGRNAALPELDLDKIREITFSHVVCWNTNTNSVALNSFLRHDTDVYCYDLLDPSGLISNLPQN